VVALDCKLWSTMRRRRGRPGLLEQGTPERLTDLEARARRPAEVYRARRLGRHPGQRRRADHDDDGRGGHLGGEPANFLEVGGEAYTKAQTALEILLDNPNIRSRCW
jgi:hypothetical protein